MCLCVVCVWCVLCVCSTGMLWGRPGVGIRLPIAAVSLCLPLACGRVLHVRVCVWCVCVRERECVFYRHVVGSARCRYSAAHRAVSLCSPLACGESFACVCVCVCVCVLCVCVRERECVFYRHVVGSARCRYSGCPSLLCLCVRR